jgi:histidine ammonia-lyase
MCALQSIDLIGKSPSPALHKIHKNARKYIQFVQQDTYFGPEIEVAKDLVMNGLTNLL